jgi:thioredoxin-dependent peroxiredoxin
MARTQPGKTDSPKTSGANDQTGAKARTRGQAPPRSEAPRNEAPRNEAPGNGAPGEGELAPDFTLAAADGETTSLSDYRGRRLVIFFYPKDDTTACTREALAFSALLTKFRRAGADVLGVSRDSPASHARFAAKHGLKLRLASDEDGAVCEAFGVWKEKKLYGKVYMGIERSTFLIGGDGRIERTWRKVKVEGHAEAVLAACDSGRPKTAPTS